jgi:hypothetical protein
MCSDGEGSASKTNLIHVAVSSRREVIRVQSTLDRNTRIPSVVVLFHRQLAGSGSQNIYLLLMHRTALLYPQINYKRYYDSAE